MRGCREYILTTKHSSKGISSGTTMCPWGEVGVGGASGDNVSLGSYLLIGRYLVGPLSWSPLNYKVPSHLVSSHAISPITLTGWERRGNKPNEILNRFSKKLLTSVGDTIRAENPLPICDELILQEGLHFLFNRFKKQKKPNKNQLKGTKCLLVFAQQVNKKARAGT